MIMSGDLSTPSGNNRIYCRWWLFHSILYKFVKLQSLKHLCLTRCVNILPHLSELRRNRFQETGSRVCQMSRRPEDKAVCGDANHNNQCLRSLTFMRLYSAQQPCKRSTLIPSPQWEPRAAKSLLDPSQLAHSRARIPAQTGRLRPRALRQPPGVTL